MRLFSSQTSSHNLKLCYPDILLQIPAPFKTGVLWQQEMAAIVKIRKEESADCLVVWAHLSSSTLTEGDKKADPEKTICDLSKCLALSPPHYYSLPFDILEKEIGHSPRSFHALEEMILFLEFETFCLCFLSPRYKRYRKIEFTFELKVSFLFC